LVGRARRDQGGDGALVPVDFFVLRGRQQRECAGRRSAADGAADQSAPARASRSCWEATKIAKVLHNDGYSFIFTAPSAGHISISCNRVPISAHLMASRLKTVMIAAAGMRFANNGSVKIKMKLTRGGRRLLAAAQQLNVIAKATFTPPGRPGITALTTLTLRR
jgi:hypothetical protein